MMRIALFAALPLLLSACTIPTAVAVYSGVEAVTFLGSGKVIPSHALSVASDHDCSLLFGITRGQFCKPKEKSLHHTVKGAGFIVPKDLPPARGRVAAASVNGNLTGVQPVLEPRFFDFDYEVAPKTEERTFLVAKTESPPAGRLIDTHQQQWTLVLGSFKEHSRAAELARQIKPEPGIVTTTLVQGKLSYIVSTKPLKRDQGTGRPLNLAALNLETVKVMPVCAIGVQKDDCLMLGQTSSIQQATLQ